MFIGLSCLIFKGAMQMSENVLRQGRELCRLDVTGHVVRAGLLEAWLAVTFG